MNNELHKQLGKIMEFKRIALRKEIFDLEVSLRKAIIDLDSDTLPNQCGIVQGAAGRIEGLVGEIHGIGAAIDLMEAEGG